MTHQGSIATPKSWKKLPECGSKKEAKQQQQQQQQQEQQKQKTTQQCHHVLID